MDKLKKVLSGQDGNDDLNVLEAASEASTLGWGARVKGFIACFAVGVLCSLLGTCLLWVPGNGLTLFAVFYTLGNIASLSSTMFLMGPLKQVKRMCEKTRALATAIMITCLILTLCAAFWFACFLRIVTLCLDLLAPWISLPLRRPPSALPGTFSWIASCRVEFPSPRGARLVPELRVTSPGRLALSFFGRGTVPRVAF